MAETRDQTSRILHALAHPVRRALLAEIRRDSGTVCALAAPHRITLAAVSKHLRVLEDAGLILRTRRGREHGFTAQEEALAAVLSDLSRQPAQSRTEEPAAPEDGLPVNLL